MGTDVLGDVPQCNGFCNHDGADDEPDDDEPDGDDEPEDE